MSVRTDFTYFDFLGDLDEFLVEGDPTLEELEIQAFGKPSIQSATHTVLLMQIYWVQGGRLQNTLIGF